MTVNPVQIGAAALTIISTDRAAYDAYRAKGAKVRPPRLSVAPTTPFQVSFAAAAMLRIPGAASAREGQLAVSGHSARARRARGHGPGTVPAPVQQRQLIASGSDAQARRRRAR